MSGATCAWLSHPPRQLLLRTVAVFLVVLVVTCKAAPITITIGSNNRTTAVVPDETQTIKVVATNPIELVSPTSLTMTCQSSPHMCSILLEMMLSPGESTTIDILLLDTERNFNQTLVLTIRESLNYSCAEYPVPKSFEEDQSSFVFTCQPFLTAGTDVKVVWRKFRLQSDLRSYQANGTGDLTSSRITNSSIFTISSDTTQLTINNSRADSSDVVYFYVPSFLLNNGTEVQTAETILYLGPRIMGEAMEFSIEIIFETDDAENLTKIRCETKTFPPSSISWLLINEEYPCEEEEEEEGERRRCGINVQSLDFDNLMLLDYGTRENLTLSTNAIIEMLDLQYDNDGNFTCTADNGYHSETRTFILRVKSPLRPLWPAIGIIGVITLVSLIMLCSYSVERIVERKKLQGYRSPASSPDHANQNQRASVSSTGGQTNNRHHGAVKRLSSAKPLIDESTF